MTKNQAKDQKVPGGPPVAEVTLSADWFELLALTKDNGRVSKSLVRELVGRNAPDMTADQVEVLVSDVFQEFKKRSSTCGSLYPFSVEPLRLVVRDSEEGAKLLYLFLVTMSLVPNFRKNGQGFQPGRAFERVCAQALETWTTGKSIVFGDMKVGGVRARIKQLGKDLGVVSHPEKARKQRKDHGLDVAAWHPFGDRRAGYPIVFCQCALGGDPIVKARQVQAGEWGSLLDIREGTVTAALAIPKVLEPEYEHWDELRYNTDLILDRQRLLAILQLVNNPWASLIPETDHVLRLVEEWQEMEKEALAS